MCFWYQIQNHLFKTRSKEVSAMALIPPLKAQGGVLAEHGVVRRRREALLTNEIGTPDPRLEP